MKKKIVLAEGHPWANGADERFGSAQVECLMATDADVRVILKAFGSRNRGGIRSWFNENVRSSNGKIDFFCIYFSFFFEFVFPHRTKFLKATPIAKWCDIWHKISFFNFADHVQK